MENSASQGDVNEKIEKFEHREINDREVSAEICITWVQGGYKVATDDTGETKQEEVKKGGPRGRGHRKGG